MVKKIAVKTAPKMKIAKYLVTVDTKKPYMTSCFNREQLRKVCKNAPLGSIVKVFAISHDFVQAYEKVADRKMKKAGK